MKVDKRKSTGPRTRNYAAKRDNEMRGASPRPLYPGREINTIPPIAKGIYEKQESNYTLREQTEENKLFQINDSIRSLLKGLETKNLLTEQKNEDKAQ